MFSRVLGVDERLQRKLDSTAISGPTRDDDRPDETDGPSSSTPKDHHKQVSSYVVATITVAVL